MVRSNSLSLAVPRNVSPISSNVTSPTEPGSLPSSPGSTTIPRIPANPTANIAMRPKDQDKDNDQQTTHYHPSTSPNITSLPPFPDTPTNVQEPSKGFFSNLKATKSSNKVHNSTESTIRRVSENPSSSRVDLVGDDAYPRKSPGSSPDLSLSNHGNDSVDHFQSPGRGISIPRRPVGSPVRSEASIARSPAEPGSNKKPKPRFGNLIGRTRSIRMDDSGRSSGSGSLSSSGPLTKRKPKQITPLITTTSPENNLGLPVERQALNAPPSTPMTAPLPPQQTNGHEHSPAPYRNRSADRHPDNGRSKQEARPSASTLHTSNSGHVPTPNAPREGPGSHLFHNIKNTSSRAAGGLNKAGKGIFAKMGRSGSSNNTKEEAQRYVCRIINLPLKEQTRITRIAARLEDSKDKTEFWMPALPWRCIDYLNFRGCEEEGLYRVPGSDKEIRVWQKRFDQEGDINLFDEEDLYDINTVGSLFKGWLRELPTEIFPKATQEKIHQANPDTIDEVPQMLKDELSMLPPWNYYLLFAITCHLSLLTAYSDKNRMSYSNLVICFQPCLKIDNFCFQFLVQRWRDCWQGCWTEKEALDKEYQILEGTATDGPGSSGGSSVGSTAVESEERSLASSKGNPPNSRSQHRPPPLAISTASDDGQALDVPYDDAQYGPARAGSQLPELAPVQPLSPIGI